LLPLSLSGPFLNSGTSIGPQLDASSEGVILYTDKNNVTFLGFLMRPYKNFVTLPKFLCLNEQLMSPTKNFVTLYAKTNFKSHISKCQLAFQI